MRRVIQPCAFPPCTRPAAVTVGLTVADTETTMVTCQAHADWLHEYAEGDPVVRLIDEPPEVTLQPGDEDDPQPAGSP